MDFISNGLGHGSVASRLLSTNMDGRVLRPYQGKNGGTYVSQDVLDSQGVPVRNADGTVKEKAVLVSNATAALRKDDWLVLDRAIVKAALPRLKAVQDLRSAGLQYTIPNGMSKTVLQYERMTNISPATISMDGLRQGQADRPLFDLNNLPLPIIHKDFQFSSRQLLESRNGQTPLDTATAEAAAITVAEAAEKLLLGTLSTYSYGGGTIYGYTNHPYRLTKSMTAPTAGGWTPATTIAEVLDMRQKSQNAFHYGPWMLYTSLSWDQYLEQDYIITGGATVATQTLRERLKKIEGIQDVRTLDFLSSSGYTMLLVQQSATVVREVVGMDITTLQWEEMGGLEVHFKVMAIMVPQIRTDIYNNTGLVHGSAS